MIKLSGKAMMNKKTLVTARVRRRGVKIVHVIYRSHWTECGLDSYDWDAVDVHLAELPTTLHGVTYRLCKSCEREIACQGEGR